MQISDDLIETIRHMNVTTEGSLDQKYADGYNDALDAVVEMMETLRDDALEEEE